MNTTLGTFSTYRVSVHSENVFIESWVNSDNIAHLMVDLEFQWRHRGIEVNPVEVVHQQDLTVTLATITGPRAFGGFSYFRYDHVPMELSVLNSPLDSTNTYGTTWPSNS